jgi:glucose-6-phosphate 1-epimerase
MMRAPERPMPIQNRADPQRFAIPGVVAVTTGRGGLPCVTVANRHADAQIYLHGAHVAHYQQRGQPPLLCMSAQSWFEGGKPIRGGVPICWPWFGPHPTDSALPAHGFARTRSWTLTQAAQTADGRTIIELALASDAETLAWWPHDFRLVYTVTVGPELILDLRVDNCGAQPFACEEALHTYLAVADVREARISGLAGATYIDKMRDRQRFVEGAEPIAIGAETDRVYLGTTATVEVAGAGAGRRLRVAKHGSQATVVWNPWIAKAKAMKDFGDEEWPGMLCIETANAADHALTVPSGGSHHLQAVLSSLSAI